MASCIIVRAVQAQTLFECDSNGCRGVVISETRLDIREGQEQSYTVKLSHRPAQRNVEVDIVVSGGTTAPITVSPASRTLTFKQRNWNTAQTVTVTADPDDDALDGRRTLAHTVQGYGRIDAAAPVQVVVADDDTAGVSILPATLEVTEGGARTYEVALTSAPVGTAVVTIVPDSNTAALITVSPASFTLNFDRHDWKTPKTVTVTATEDDDVFGGTRTLMHSVSGYPGVSAGSVTVTVTDNDTATVALEVANAMVAESVGMVTVRARLDVAVQGGFTVEASTDDGTATAPGDYTAFRQRVLNFKGDMGEVQTFTVAIEDDSTVEIDETFRVLLGGLRGTSGRVAASSGTTLTITDTDTATVTLGAETVNEGIASGTVTITATLDNPVQGGFTVEASTGDGTATAPGDYTTTTTMLTFVGTEGGPQSFTVAITNDSTAEPSETFNVSLGTPVPATAPVGRISVAAATVTITDDDADNVTVTLGAASV